MGPLKAVQCRNFNATWGTFWLTWEKQKHCGQKKIKPQREGCSRGEGLWDPCPIFVLWRPWKHPMSLWIPLLSCFSVLRQCVICEPL